MFHADQLLGAMIDSTAKISETARAHGWAKLGDIDEAFTIMVSQHVLLRVRMLDAFEESGDPRRDDLIVASSPFDCYIVFESLDRFLKLARTKRARNSLADAAAQHQVNLTKLPKGSDGTPDQTHILLRN